MEDLEAWQRIVDATGVNQLMAALQHIGLKAGVLVQDPAPQHPVTGANYPVTDTGSSNGDSPHEAETATAE